MQRQEHPSGSISKAGSPPPSGAAIRAEAWNVLEIALCRLRTLTQAGPGESPAERSRRQGQASDFFTMALESCQTLQDLDGRLTPHLLRLQSLVSGAQLPFSENEQLQHELELLTIHVHFADHSGLK